MYDGRGAGRFCVFSQPLNVNQQRLSQFRRPIHFTADRPVHAGAGSPSRRGPFEDELAMFEDGVAAYQHIDYATALNFLRPLAEQGDVNAQCNLGLMYYNGEDVPRDFTEAETWWRMAAEQGHAEAQFNLGVMYANGLGVTQDFAEAVKWYRKAAEQGDTDAQNKLGVVYSLGRGVPRDYVPALMWLNLAVAQGNDKAQKCRDRTAKRMTPDQIAEAQRMAREWMVKHQQ